MSEGANAVSVDLQIAAEIAIGRVRDILPGPHSPLHAGSGGSGGRYRLDSIAALDAVIAQWKVILDKIAASQRKLITAFDRVASPAGDQISNFEAMVTKNSIRHAINHNVAMHNYARAYIAKLTSARQAYVTVETENELVLRSTGGH
ncbi:hypothetical protein [Actinokineospora inagensis]|uniref:hypothetical protein n=1 Tax=Actinokineospora inagensis TaxID=103730 RepID=UPI0004279828|nr:hypothetical protein [Actinokineospora inagensis]